MQIYRLTPHVGAEVTGIDLRAILDEASRRRLNEAVVEHVALVIRDQQFTPEQYLAAVSLFGEPMEQHFTQYALPQCPLVHEVERQTASRTDPNSAALRRSAERIHAAKRARPAAR